MCCVYLVALKGPDVEKAQLLLLRLLDLRKFSLASPPVAIHLRDLLDHPVIAGELIENIELRCRREQALLFVLAMDVTEGGREIAQQRHCRGAVAHERSRFSTRENFTFDQNLAVFRRDAAVFQYGRR